MQGEVQLDMTEDSCHIYQTTVITILLAIHAIVIQIALDPVFLLDKRNLMKILPFDLSALTQLPCQFSMDSPGIKRMAMLLIKQCPRVLAIGAHPDDIELGAGGLIHRLIRDQRAEVHFLIMTAGIQSRGPEHYEADSREQEARQAAETLGVPRQNVEVLQFPDCNLQAYAFDIIGTIEKRLYAADGSRRFDLVLAHAGEDNHADHRTVYESTVSALRDFDGTLLLYASPSTKPNGFRPTLFVDLDEESVKQIGSSLKKHASQRDKPFMQMSRMRNIAESWSLFLRRPSGTFLEAFEVSKCII